MSSGHFNCLLVRTCWTLFVSISLVSLWSVCGDTIPSTINRFKSLEQGLASRDQPSNEKNEENARLQEELIKDSLKQIEDEIDPAKEDDAYLEPEATEDYPAYLPLKNLLTEEEPEEKRSRFFKADLGKRFMMRGDLGKRFMMRGDLGKRFAMRSDLGKRFYMRGDLGKEIRRSTWFHAGFQSCGRNRVRRHWKQSTLEEADVSIGSGEAEDDVIQAGLPCRPWKVAMLAIRWLLSEQDIKCNLSILFILCSL